MIKRLTSAIYGVRKLEGKNADKDFLSQLHKKAVDKFEEVYSSIFGEISSMLRKAKLMPMVELQKNNPTFTEIAAQLKIYRDFSALAVQLLKIDKDNEINTLDEHITLTTNLAKAIDEDDADALCAAIAALDEKPYI